MGLLGAALGFVGTLVGLWLRRRSDRDSLRASPYDALASRIVTLEASDESKRSQIVALTTKVMTLEATNETRRILLTKAATKHAGVVAHVDYVEEWIEARTPGAIPPQLDPELRTPVVTG